MSIQIGSDAFGIKISSTCPPGAGGLEGPSGVQGEPGQAGVSGRQCLSLDNWPLMPDLSPDASLLSVKDQINFNGMADFGRRVNATVPTAQLYSGDFLSELILQITLPEINQSMSKANAGSGVWARWVDYIGEHIIESIELQVNGKVIESHSGDSMHINQELTATAESKKKYHQMIGHTPELVCFCAPGQFPLRGPAIPSTALPRNGLPETTLYIPLQFWFCRDLASALPIGQLPLGSVKIEISFRPLDECLIAVDANPYHDPMATKVDAPYLKSLVAASIIGTFTTVSSQKRAKLFPPGARIEQAISICKLEEHKSVGSSSNLITFPGSPNRLKELIWVVQRDEMVDYANSLTPIDDAWQSANLAAQHKWWQVKRYGPQPFNYTDAFDYNSRSFDLSQDILDAIKVDPQTALRIYGAELAHIFQKVKQQLDTSTWGQNPIVVAELHIPHQFNVPESEGCYFDTTQPWQHHTGSGNTGINVISFSQCPELATSSGWRTFPGPRVPDPARPEQAKLKFELTNAAVGGTRTAKLRIYTTSISTFVTQVGPLADSTDCGNNMHP